MAINFPGPYELRYNYIVSGREHQHRVNLDLEDPPVVGADFDQSTALTRLGTPSASTLDVDADDYIDLIRDEFNNGVSFTNVELWAYTPLSFESSYVSSLSLALSGTTGTSTKPASQEIYVFRTQEGGIMKLTFLDTIQDFGVARPYPDLSSTQAALVDAVLLSSNWILARDTSYPISFIAMYPGQNEALFKKIYR